MTGPYEGRLSRLIRHRRQELRFSQQQLAEVLRVTPEFFSQVEYGHRQLSLDSVALLAHALAIDSALLCMLALKEQAPFLFQELFRSDEVAELAQLHTIGGHA